MPAQPITPIKLKPRAEQVKELVGLDVFVQWAGSVNSLAEALQLCNANGLDLQMVTNRGVKVWPEGFPETSLTDHWRCRFITNPYRKVAPSEVTQLIEQVYSNGLDFIKAETLCLFDGELGFSLGQGQ